MNICFLVGNLNLAGGTERTTILLANALSQHHEIFTLNIQQGETPFFTLQPNIKNAYLFDHPVSMKRYAISTILKIRAFIKAHQIDCLIVVDSISCVFTVPALMGLNVKHICWEHFNFDINLGTRLRDWGRKLASRYCDAVVTLTEHDATHWQNALPHHHAKIIAIANLSAFNIQTTNPTQVNKTVLSVGRLRHEKGFDLLIQAWQQVVKQYPNWQLKIIGSGEQADQLKQSTTVVDNIQFIPNTADLTLSYQQASIYCLPSRFEGFGMVLVEAMSFGLPIVAFDCKIGPKEILKNTLNTLVEAENTQALADALCNMIAMQAKQYDAIVVQNKKHAQQYQADAILPRWLELINA
ncbi:glycosyltransferase family 4 protein [Acinetobacter sp. HY1485]|uniref:glycosyltransferase family 4 protein n=1 Tax=Acinetobacter sp. HY1485 TaxID=2970918 RepID=UPI0022B96167|nr:glycosyltransferase family 4 protein [Acinetobacter sp. HY1485]